MEFDGFKVRKHVYQIKAQAEHDIICRNILSKLINTETLNDFRILSTRK